MAKRITRINRGDKITAVRLNEYGDNINTLNKFVVDAPQQVNKAPDPAVQTEAVDDEIESANTYQETSRVVSTVQVFDQNDENYAEIDRIESITFQNGEGMVLKLQFDNPVI